MKRNALHFLSTMMLLTFLLNTLKAQDIPEMPINPNTNKIEYNGVIQVEGSASELYTRSLAWINSFFPNASSVTRVRDSNNNLIEGLHRIRLMNKLEDGTEVFAGHVQYEFKFLFREGRFRYEITNFSAREISRTPVERWLDKNDSSYTRNTPYYFVQIDKFVKDLVESMTNGMQPKVEVIEEW